MNLTLDGVLMADRLLLNCGITCWRQLCFWCWNCLKLVGGVMRRLEWRVLNVHMTERALFCFPYWRENILAIITIILEVVCSRIIWLSIGVILGKSWAAFVINSLKFLRYFCCCGHGLELLLLKKKLRHIIRGWSFCRVLKKILLYCLQWGSIF